jgi:GntR family transcriptional regulator
MATRLTKQSNGNGLGRVARGGGPGDGRHLLPQQTRDAIVEALHVEGLTVGARLPNEFVLADRLGVSRSTIREAMKLLEQEGVVEVRPGKGRFVSVTTELEPERPITQFESLNNMMRALGYEVSTVVLSVIQRKATESERSDLGVRASAKVVETRRLRERDGTTVIYSVNIIDASVLDRDADEIDWSGSVVDLLDGCGQVIIASSAHIKAVDSPQPEDELPDHTLPRGPWLYVNERCVTRDGRCVLAARDYHLGEMFTFSVLRRRHYLPGTAGAETGRTASLLEPVAAEL